MNKRTGDQWLKDVEGSEQRDNRKDGGSVTEGSGGASQEVREVSLEVGLHGLEEGKGATCVVFSPLASTILA